MILEKENKIKKLKISRNLSALTSGLSLTCTSLSIIKVDKNPSIFGYIEISIGCLIALYSMSRCYQDHCDLIELKKNQKQLLKISKQKKN